jgi:ABC-type transporter Mla subunit MlaD
MAGIKPAMTQWALLIGLWLAWDTFSKRGPTITITFDSGEGLQAGQSHIKHKDVVLGLVTDVALSPDASHVTVTAEMTRKAEPFLTDQTRFRVVTPRLFAGQISGLDTLISGTYTELLPDPEHGRLATGQGSPHRTCKPPSGATEGGSSGANFRRSTCCSLIRFPRKFDAFQTV